MNSITSKDFINIISEDKEQYIVFYSNEDKITLDKVKKIIPKNILNLWFLNYDDNKNLELCNYLEINSFVIFGFKNGDWTRYKAKDFTEKSTKKFLKIKN